MVKKRTKTRKKKYREPVIYETHGLLAFTGTCSGAGTKQTTPTPCDVLNS